MDNAVEIVGIIIGLASVLIAYWSFRHIMVQNLRKGSLNYDKYIKNIEKLSYNKTLHFVIRYFKKIGYGWSFIPNTFMLHLGLAVIYSTLIFYVSWFIGGSGELGSFDALNSQSFNDRFRITAWLGIVFTFIFLITSKYLIKQSLFKGGLSIILVITLSIIIAVIVRQWQGEDAQKGLSFAVIVMANTVVIAATSSVIVTKLIKNKIGSKLWITIGGIITAGILGIIGLAGSTAILRETAELKTIAIVIIVIVAVGLLILLTCLYADKLLYKLYLRTKCKSIRRRYLCMKKQSILQLCTILFVYILSIGLMFCFRYELPLEILIAAFFILLLPLCNGIMDAISGAISFCFIQKAVNKKWNGKLLIVLIDCFFAILSLLVLAFLLCFATKLFNELIIMDCDYHIPLANYIKEITDNHWSLERLWVMLMLVTTIFPTLFHSISFFVSGFYILFEEKRKTLEKTLKEAQKIDDPKAISLNALSWYYFFTYESRMLAVILTIPLVLLSFWFIDVVFYFRCVLGWSAEKGEQSAQMIINFFVC